MLIDSLTISQTEFEAGTGWLLKPEGACKGDVCIPLIEPPTSGEIDVTSLATQMGLPVVADEKHELWAVGPDATGSRTLVSAVAPEFRLPDLDGNEFSLASLRGQKVLLVAWSPY